MYAIIETGGKQYRVSAGDVIQVDSIPGETGTPATIGKVIAVAPDEGGILSGEKNYRGQSRGHHPPAG